MKNIEFINAGAGSGKTYELTKILCDNIKNGNCRADQVILTTFTHKAAAEFKAKAREKLLEAGMTGQANLLASAAIGTVHSVALQLIKKYWYLLGVPSEMDVMPQDDVDFFINQALANIPNHSELSTLRDIARQLGFSNPRGSGTAYDSWKTHLKQILSLVISNRITDLEESKNKSLEEVNHIFPPCDFTLTEDQIRDVMNRFLLLIQNDRESKTKQTRIKNVTGILQKSNWKVPEFIEASKAFSDYTNGHLKVMPEITEVIHEINQIYRSPSCLNLVRSYITIVFNLAQKSLKKFQDYKIDNRIIDYNDMENMLLQLLEVEHVKEEIQGQFKQVYVDEFQDSSPAQFAIFNKLSDLMTQSYWVGDPKQAIYGFRGTDPALIQSIVDTFSSNTETTGLTTKKLEYSWRSRPGIVNFCNAIFKKALQHQVEPSLITLDPIRSDNELPSDTNHVPVQHWHHEDTSKTRNVTLKWQHLASQISTFLNEGVEVTTKKKCRYSIDKKNPTIVTHKVKPSDIAVLCRKNEAVSQLSGALKKAGLKVSSKQHGLIECSETHLLIAAINYLLDHSDQLAKAVLIMLSGAKASTSELIDDRLEYLYAPNAPEKPVFDENSDSNDEKYRKWYEHLTQWHDNQEVLMRIKALNKETAHLSVPLIIEKLIINGGLDTMVQNRDNAAQRQANLQTLAAFAHKYDQRCLTLKIASSLRGYIQYISNLPESTLMESAAAGEDAVNVLTHHGSKGLEWPVVVLADLEHDALPENDLIYKEFFGVSLVNPTEMNLDSPFTGKYISLMPWPFGTAKKVPDDTIANNIRQHPRYEDSKANVKNELARLLYVGFTRARDILVTTSYKQKNLTWLTNALGDIPFNNQVKNLKEGDTELDIVGCGIPVLVKVDHYDPETGTNEEQKEMVKTLKSVVSEGNHHLKFISPGTVKPVEAATVTVLKDFNQRMGITGAGNLGEAAIGDFLHDAFAAYTPYLEKDTYTELVTNTMKRHHLEGIITSPEQVHHAIVQLYSFLLEQYGDPLKIYRELPLQLYRNGQVYRGDADLLWETENELILVDY